MSKKIKVKVTTKTETKVYIVVTIVKDGERDLFSDVALVTTDRDKAEKLACKLDKHKTVKALDWLCDYDTAEYIERTLK